MWSAGEGCWCLGGGLSHGKKGNASRDTVVGKMTLKFANPAIGMVPGQNF